MRIALGSLLHSRRYLPLALTLAALLASIVATVLFLNASHQQTLNLWGKELAANAIDLANTINATPHAAIRHPADASTDSYRAISEQLEKGVRHLPFFAYAFTVRFEGDKALLIVAPPADFNGDGLIYGPLEERASVGTLYKDAPLPSIEAAVQGRSSFADIATDQRGIWLPACASLDPSGKHPRDAVCLIANAAPLLSHFRTIDLSILLAIVFGTICAALTAAILLTRYEERQLLRARSREHDKAIRQFESSFVHLSHVAIQGIDRHGMIRLWNRGSEQLYGISREDAEGRMISDLLMTGDDAAKLKEQIEHIWLTQQSLPLHEWTIHSRQGKTLTLLSTMFPLIVEQEIRGIYCFDIDISTRQEREQQLLAQITRFRDLQERLIAREGRMIELKREINELRIRLGEEAKYVV